jgi:hypothetical protein
MVLPLTRLDPSLTAGDAFVELGEPQSVLQMFPPTAAPQERQVRILALLYVNPVAAVDEAEVLLQCDDLEVVRTVRLNLAVCYLLAGRQDDAQGWIDKLVGDDDPGAFRAALNLAVTQQATDPEPAAASALAEVALRSPEPHVAAQARAFLDDLREP